MWLALVLLVAGGCAKTDIPLSPSKQPLRSTPGDEVRQAWHDYLLASQTGDHGVADLVTRDTVAVHEAYVEDALHASRTELLKRGGLHVLAVLFLRQRFAQSELSAMRGRAFATLADQPGWFGTGKAGPSELTSVTIDGRVARARLGDDDGVPSIAFRHERGRWRVDQADYLKWLGARLDQTIDPTTEQGQDLLLTSLRGAVEHGSVITAVQLQELLDGPRVHRSQRGDSGSGHDGTRVALVVGNGLYENTTRLDQAPRDAAQVADALTALGFEVTVLLDADRSTFSRQLVDFGRSLRGARVGFVYYAGHAIQVNDTNYLIPVDARIEDPGYADSEAIDAQSVLNEMARADTPLNVVVIDACRNNPFANQWSASSRSFGLRGIATLAPPKQGFLIGYATDPGDVAPDNGAYARALARHIQTPCADLPLVFDRVFDDISAETAGRQRPWLNSAAGEVARTFHPAGCESAANPLEVAETVSQQGGSIVLDVVATNISPRPVTLNRLVAHTETDTRMNCDSSREGRLRVEGEYDIHARIGGEDADVAMDPPLQLPEGEAVRLKVALHPNFRGACERILSFDYQVSIFAGQNLLGRTATYRANSADF